MHHRNDFFACGCRGGGLFYQPLLTGCFQVAAGLAVVTRVTTRYKGVEPVHAGVDGQDGKPLGDVAAIAQCVIVATGMLVIARMAVYLGKLVARDGLGGSGGVAVIHSCIGVVDVMVAGDDEHLDAGICQTLQAVGDEQVACPLAVLGEVAGHEHQVGFQVDDIRHQGVENLHTLTQHLAVTVQVLLKGAAVLLEQFGCHHVQVTDDGYLDGLFQLSKRFITNH